MNNTNTCYLDSNILVYLKEVSATQHKQSIVMLEKLVSNEYVLCVSPLCLDEFLYTAFVYLKKAGVKDVAKELKQYLGAILKIPNLTIINPPIEKSSQYKVIAYMGKFSLRPRDAYHLLAIKANKIKYLATFDKDFDKVFEARILKRLT